MGKGGLPQEIVEADIAERYSWTYSELDNEDADRVYTGFAMQNIRDSIQRVKSWLDHSGKIHISESDLEVWGMIMKADDKDDNG